MYEDTSRKDSAGCLSVIMHPKPTAEAPASHDITEHRVGSLYQVIEFLGLGVNVTEEGVFRKAGSFKKQQDLLEKVEKGEDLELETGPYSIHECASVLKTFLSRLSEPLVTNSCYQARCQQNFKEHYSEKVPSTRPAPNCYNNCCLNACLVFVYNSVDACSEYCDNYREISLTLSTRRT